MLKEKFINWLTVEKQYSTHTITAYLRDLESLERFLFQQEGQILFSESDLANIHHRSIRSWMGDLLENGLSHRSVARNLSSAKTYFTWLQKMGTVQRNPASRIKLPKFEKKLPAFLRESETEYLFEQIAFPEGWTGARDKCILEILYGCGLRRGELMGLTWADIDVYQQQMTVMGKGNKARIIPFGKHVQAAIKAYKNAAQLEGISLEKSIFVKDNGEPIYPKWLYNKVKLYLSGVSSLAQTSPHVLRHTFATHMLDNGADLNAIKELLGHSSLASTQVYTHNTIAKLKSVHNQAHPRANNHKDD